MEEKKYFEVRNLSKEYHDEVGFNVNLLEDVSFEVLENSITTILAPTGAGKSSILKIVSGLEFATKGQIEINSPNRRIVFIPSKPSSFPWYSVRDNINLVKKENVNFEEVIKLVGLEGYEDHMPDNRSAGFRFRISLARAIAVNTDIITIDEPFKYMAPNARQRIYELILGIKKKTNISFVIATTNLSEAILLSDKIYVMKKNPGKIINSINIDLGRDRSLDSMNSEKFFEYRTHVEKILKSDKSQLLSDITI